MPDRIPTVLFFGPPGSGKGTQGKAVGAIPGFFHCACGDVFRRINPNSDIGKVFMDYSSRGELVPDDVTVKLWSQHVKAQEVTGAFKPDSDLLILDGIPRNIHQAKIMDELLRVLEVVELECPDEEKMINRLRRRAIKENRLDDAKEDVIRHRWEVYRAETEPVLQHYDKKLRRKVNAQESPAEVLRAVLDVLIPVQNEHFKRVKPAAPLPSR